VYRGSAGLSLKTPRSSLLIMGCFPKVTPLTGVMIADKADLAVLMDEYPDVELLNKFARKFAFSTIIDPFSYVWLILFMCSFNHKLVIKVSTSGDRSWLFRIVLKHDTPSTPDADGVDALLPTGLVVQGWFC